MLRYYESYVLSSLVGGVNLRYYESYVLSSLVGDVNL